MNKYTFRADSRTRQSLRLLSLEWIDYKIFHDAVVVINLCNGQSIMLTVHIVDKEDKFECSRICAETNLAEQTIPVLLPGPNRVEILEDEDWVQAEKTTEPGSNLFGNNPVSQFIGSPDCIPPDAIASCLSHSGVLITFSQKSRIAIVCGDTPATLEVIQDSPEL